MVRQSGKSVVHLAFYEMWKLSAFWTRFVAFIPRQFASVLRFFRWQIYWRTYWTRSAKRGEETVSVKSSQPALKWLLINLDRRPDRLRESAAELSKMGFDWVRFRANENSNGALGCARSHIQALKTIEASVSSSTYVIAEDDIEFLVDSARLNRVISGFLRDERLDVLCLSFRTFGLRVPISSELSVSNQILTTGAYIPKKHAISRLIECFEEAEGMLAEGEPKEVAAIDVVWQELQLNHVLFAIPKKLLLRQRESYSDVARKHAHYYFK